MYCTALRLRIDTSEIKNDLNEIEREKEKLFKSKRIVNKKLIRQLKETKRCIICNIILPDMHHVTSVGAGGDDVVHNLMPLCRIHHVKIHTIGIKRMCDHHPEVRRWLEDHGRFDVLGRLDAK